MQAKSKEQEQGRNPWSRCPGRPAIGWSRQNSVRSEIYEPPTTDDWDCAVAVPRFCLRNIPSGNDAFDSTSVKWPRQEGT